MLNETIPLKLYDVGQGLYQKVILPNIGQFLRNLIKKTLNRIRIRYELDQQRGRYGAKK